MYLTVLSALFNAQLGTLYIHILAVANKTLYTYLTVLSALFNAWLGMLYVYIFAVPNKTWYVLDCTQSTV